MTGMPTAMPTASSDAWAVLQLLLRGQLAAEPHLANALRVEAYGCRTFGRTDALDLFAARPLALSPGLRRVMSPQGIAVLDTAADGRAIGVFADLTDGVIDRLWLVSDCVHGATAEPAVPVARDDFMSQLRMRCEPDPADHPHVHASAWPDVVQMGRAALHAAQEPVAASTGQVWVMRAFCTETSVAALYRLRVLAAVPPRHVHERLALAIARIGPQSLPTHPCLALSDPLPQPAPVYF